VLDIRAEPWKKKKGDNRPCWRRGRRDWLRHPQQRRGRDLTKDGDSATGRDVAGGGEVKKLRVGWGILGSRVRWSPKLGKIDGFRVGVRDRVRWSPELGKGRWSCGGAETVSAEAPSFIIICLHYIS
jgi:hypothetical protein